MMKPLGVRTRRFACLVTLLLCGISTGAFAQTTWTVQGNSALNPDTFVCDQILNLDTGEVGDSNGNHLGSFAHTNPASADSINFQDNAKLLIMRVNDGQNSFIRSFTTDNPNEGAVVYYDNFSQTRHIPFSSRPILAITDQIGTANNPLGMLTNMYGAILVDGNLYADKVRLENGLLYITNNATIKELSATKREETGSSQLIVDGTLTVSEGYFDGLISGNGSLVKAGSGTLQLGNLNVYQGDTTIKEGRLIMAGPPTMLFSSGMIGNYVSFGNGETSLEKDAVLQVGDSYYASSLFFGNGTTFTGNGGTLDLFTNARGDVAKVWFSDVAAVNGQTPVQIGGDINHWGSRILKTPDVGFYTNMIDPHLLMFSTSTDIKDSFLFEDNNVLETSRYKINFKHDSDGSDNYWYATAAPQDIIIPDISTMMLTNIIGFEMPRAQNVNGPWAKIKGGQLYDNKSMFNNNSYQTLQVGWDKRMDALNCEKSYWNAGMFFEGDWMYGRGNYRSSCQGVPGNIYGNLSSNTSGMGAGLYLSRTNHNNIYFNVAGRLNLFDNKAYMNTMQSPEMNNYRSAWTSQTFSLAMELGKRITSKNGRFSFNPYNQLIYVSAPGNDFDVIFGDNSIVNVRTDRVDAWTNKLGGLASLNFKNRENRVNRTIFGSMNYYQGLSGTFSTQMLDTLNPSAKWVTTPVGRPKNNLSYATGIVGFTLLPKENIQLAAQTNLLFGDISGWSASLTGAIGF